MNPFFNPSSREFISDPYPFYHQLRTTDPYYKSPFGFVAVTRDRDVRAILSDGRFGREFRRRDTPAGPGPILPDTAIQCMANWMLFRDPPNHMRLRGLVVKAFTARRVQDMRPLIQSTVDEVLDRLAARDGVELVADFANMIPGMVICELLGIPTEDRPAVLANSAGLVRLFDPVPLSRREAAHANSQVTALSEYLHRLFDLRRQNPQDDLTTQLVLAEEHGDRLSPEELTDNVILLLAAGYETTTSLIGNALLALFRHPDQLALLRNGHSLAGSAVEELLRYDSSVQLTSRVALEDVAFGDKIVRKGGAVICALGSANRDPEIYDQPDRLDITRQNIRMSSFGGGIHYCLGAQLARLEIEIAIGGIIDRFPNLRLDSREEPVWRPNMSLRGLSSLRARL